MVGMWTRIQAALKHGTGFADPEIYRIAENATDFARVGTTFRAGVRRC